MLRLVPERERIQMNHVDIHRSDPVKTREKQPVQLPRLCCVTAVDGVPVQHVRGDWCVDYPQSEFPGPPAALPPDMLRLAIQIGHL